VRFWRAAVMSSLFLQQTGLCQQLTGPGVLCLSREVEHFVQFNPIECKKNSTYLAEIIATTI
jgi:hypothetical protein